MSECNIIFENNQVLNIYIGEEPNSENKIPLPLEYSTPGVIYVFTNEELFSEIFLEVPTSENPDEAFDLPVFNISNSAGINIYPFQMERSDDIDLANSIFSELRDRINLDAKKSQNSDLIQFTLKNCELTKEYSYFDIYSSFSLSQTKKEAHIMLVVWLIK